MLTRNWVLTAAHCVKDIAYYNILARIGEYNFLEENEPHGHIDRRISQVDIHANFDKVSQSQLKLDWPRTEQEILDF